MAKEKLDAIEKTMDVIENNFDKIEEAQAYIAEQKSTLILSGVAIGFGLGVAIGTVGYILAKKRIQAKYEAVLEEERIEMKAYYERHYKKGDFETPASAAERFGAKVAENAMRDYRGQGAKTAEAEKTEVEIVEQEIVADETAVKNIFTENESTVEWDQEQEESKRAANPDEPFIITEDEFGTNEDDYDQITLTYYAEDDVLVDEHEKPIEEIDKIVGEGNLLRFGHGSRDNNIVYIRNNHLSYDFEVIKREASYAKEVLGFQHTDSGGSRKTKKFRVGDYE